MSLPSPYFAPIYQPPPSAATIGAILRAPRNIRHHGNFSYVFSPEREEQLEYVNGVMAVASVFLIVWVLWAFVLLVLKFKGKQVGCASGRAFVTARSDDEGEKQFGDTRDDISSTSESSGVESNSSKPFFTDFSRQDSKFSREKRRQPKIKYDDEMNLVASVTDPDDEQSTGSLSRSSGWISRSYSDGDGNELRSLESQRVAAKINPRENRTRICFVIFASIALLCVPLILIFSYGPMKEATDGSEQLILSIRDSMDQVEASLNSIETASRSAAEILDSTPTDLAVICPLVPAHAFEADLGVDLSNIVRSVADEYNGLKEEVTSQLAVGNNLVDRVDTSVTNFEASVDTTEKYMWAIPALLFAIGVLSAVSILGVVMAWKEKSDFRFQRTMSWIVLPLLILASIACWMVVVFASMGSMVGTDLCLSSSRTGSPDQTIQEILSFHLSANDTTFQLVSAYTNQCQGPDPGEQIDTLVQEIQGHIDNIWRQMSLIDSLGRSTVIAKCGDEETFTSMLSAARNLARLLTAIRRSLSIAERSLKCDKINPIYVEAAHQAICTNALTGTVNGFILFLIVSTCVMVMISLRASWLRHIEEEKVYHDEDEVVENMILDEHEEYLAYISKYKHEWQEYEGFDKDGAVGSEGDDDYMDDEAEYDDVDSYVFEESSDVSGLDICSSNFGADPPTTSYGYDSAVEGVTYISDEISFHSLSVERSEDDRRCVLPEKFQTSKSLLLHPPPPKNPEHRSVTPSGVVPLHHAATAPSSSTQLCNGSNARSDVQRRAFYGTSARKARTGSFAQVHHSVTNANFDTDTNETEDNMGFEVQIRL
ncbi:hypothetical protein IV203_011764 [Nitzschia inconspicua]|uniref:Uncharacterized protein n=1 Tax=Nitzschia inconspicua TaxID=303405 RepID=A0A9K3PIQ2_9STRA|nr:hypothetical protein IV203_011764 [Nitzschia inconspicua]